MIIQKVGLLYLNQLKIRATVIIHSAHINIVNEFMQILVFYISRKNRPPVNCKPTGPPSMYTEKNLLVNFTFFIRKFIIFIVTLGHTQNVGFLLF